MERLAHVVVRESRRQVDPGRRRRRNDQQAGSREDGCRCQRPLLTYALHRAEDTPPSPRSGVHRHPDRQWVGTCLSPPPLAAWRPALPSWRMTPAFGSERTQTATPPLKRRLAVWGSPRALANVDALPSSQAAPRRRGVESESTDSTVDLSVYLPLLWVATVCGPGASLADDLGGGGLSNPPQGGVADAPVRSRDRRVL